MSLAIGGLSITVPDLRRTPDVEVALGFFLRALADEIDGGDGNGQGGTEPQSDRAAPEVG